MEIMSKLLVAILIWDFLISLTVFFLGTSLPVNQQSLYQLNATQADINTKSGILLKSFNNTPVQAFPATCSDFFCSLTNATTNAFVYLWNLLIKVPLISFILDIAQFAVNLVILIIAGLSFASIMFFNIIPSILLTSGLGVLGTILISVSAVANLILAFYFISYIIKFVAPIAQILAR